eukprot:4780801-Pyramimonas_sp.AAC.1
MLRAPQWMLRAPQWMLRAQRAVFVSSRAFFSAPAKHRGERNRVLRGSYLGLTIHGLTALSSPIPSALTFQRGLWSRAVSTGVNTAPGKASAYSLMRPRVRFLSLRRKACFSALMPLGSWTNPLESEQVTTCSQPTRATKRISDARTEGI